MTDSFWQRVKCVFGGHRWLGDSREVHIGSTRVCRGLRCQVSQRLVLAGYDFVWRRE